MRRILNDLFLLRDPLRGTLGGSLDQTEAGLSVGRVLGGGHGSHRADGGGQQGQERLSLHLGFS